MKGTPGNVLTVALSDDQMVLFARATVQAMLDNIMRGGAPVPQPAAPSFEQCTAIPMIGQPWPGQGGIYAGMVRGDDGLPDYHLILAEHEPEDRMAWQAAMDYAGTVEADGHKDFTLPKRKEQAILFGNLKERLKEAWYWSCEPHASYSDYAWYQYFSSGSQDYGHKDNNLRARAVRRLVIQ